MEHRAHPPLPLRVTRPEPGRFWALQKVQEERVQVRQLRRGERFQLCRGHATDTEGDQVSEAWFQHLLYIVWVLPHTLDRVSRTKMSLQSWRRWRHRRER